MFWLHLHLMSILCMQHVFTVTVPSCDSEIYCKGELLYTVQYAVKIYKDSKTFVDMSQIHSPNVTLANFKALMNKTNNKPTHKDVQDFIDTNFDQEGELDEWTPPDFSKNPSFLNRIENDHYREFAQKLVNIWPKLARKVRANVLEHPDRHSLIPVPNGFIIPGGRFNEIYYWDSYWIIRGLLISEMHATARGMIENLMFLVKKFGFVPNGSRVFYLNRSQPPLLTHMVKLYWEATKDINWLKSNIAILVKELNWWQEKRTIVITKDGVSHRLARYAVESNTPRPESYSEDINTCNYYTKEAAKENCYQNLKSGAESGWDFSSRWIIEPNGKTANLSFVKVEGIIPVDLNAYLCGAYKELARYHDILGNKTGSANWWKRANLLEKAIEAVLYDYDDGIWYDYEIDKKVHRKRFYPSNFAPLWAEAYNTYFRSSYGARAAKYFQNHVSENEQSGGIPTSLIESGEQWDLPNAWPPLQEIIILGLYNTGNDHARQIALSSATTWVGANELGFKRTGLMFEKYDALVPGQYGGGGEYTVQSGFGWTNGVILSLLDKFPHLPGNNTMNNKLV